MHPLDPLGEVLVASGLLLPEQWLQACEGPGEDLGAVLDRLGRMPAWWSAEPAPALTAYQRGCVERLHARGRPAARLAAALRWGDYLVLARLGEGGMGVVYQAWDVAGRRMVAVKRIKGSSAETHRRFRREARLQRRLRHPAVARFLDLVRWRGATLLVLEFLDGRTLADEVKARGPVPWREAAGWAISLLGALDHAHGLKVIHRDLKPSNIFIPRRPDGAAAKLLDLGLAKCLDPAAMTDSTAGGALTAGNALLGTYEYMAPEQWRGADSVVAASDVYSLGCCLFYALAGRPPFAADSLVAYCHAHTNTPPPQLAADRADVPPAVDALVRQMLAKDPASRGAPSRLLGQFEELLRPRPPDVAAAPPPQPRKTDPAPAADERFAPFTDSAEVEVWGARVLLRALLVSRGLAVRLLLLLFAALGAAGILLLCFHR